jgi:hypothetical protein
MNKLISLGIISAISMLITNTSHAAEHHSGHNNMSGGGSASHCIKAHISKFNPEHLANVKAGAEFSFVAFNVYKPELINVTVKNQPVEVETEFKDPFYKVTAKLPPDLKETAARITVKIAGKAPACDSEGGWLLKID